MCLDLTRGGGKDRFGRVSWAGAEAGELGTSSRSFLQNLIQRIVMFQNIVRHPDCKEVSVLTLKGSPRLIHIFYASQTDLEYSRE